MVLRKDDSKNFPKSVRRLFVSYAHIDIVIAFLVVNFFTQMVIVRNHGVGQVPGLVKMNPTSPPELFKPFRDLGKRRKKKHTHTQIPIFR